MRHETELVPAGTYYAWQCNCGRSSRHLLPQHLAIRNAKSHERKYNQQLPAERAP